METIECKCDKCGMGFFVSIDCINLEIQKTNNGGKYIRKITGENKRKIKKRLNKWVKEVKNGKMEKSKMEEKFSSWKNHALHGNCIKLVHSMDSYVEKLFKEQ